MNTSKNRIEIYDVTLRDGARMSGICYSWKAITDAIRSGL